MLTKEQISEILWSNPEMDKELFEKLMKLIEKTASRMAESGAEIMSEAIRQDAVTSAKEAALLTMMAEGLLLYSSKKAYEDSF